MCDQPEFQKKKPAKFLIINKAKIESKKNHRKKIWMMSQLPSQCAHTVDRATCTHVAQFYFALTLVSVFTLNLPPFSSFLLCM